MDEREFFVIMRSTPGLDNSVVLLVDIYEDGNEYAIGSYPDETAFKVFLAVKTTLREVKNANRKP